MTIDPIEQVRKTVDRILQEQKDVVVQRAGFIHLYGVSLMATVLALKRNLDLNTASIAAMLHDIATHKTADSKNHAIRSAKEASSILSQLDEISEQKAHIIKDAIRNHSDKNQFHGEYAELLKDADVLHHFLYNPNLPIFPHEQTRLNRVLEELGIKSL